MPLRKLKYRKISFRKFVSFSRPPPVHDRAVLTLELCWTQIGPSWVHVGAMLGHVGGYVGPSGHVDFLTRPSARNFV